MGSTSIRPKPPTRLVPPSSTWAGDALYLPRGVMHEATTSDTESLHITLGVLHNNWTELLVESLARLSLRDPELRKALPCGYARDDFDRSAARETFHRLLAEAVGRVDFDEAFDHFVEDVISTRHPVHNEQRHAVRAAATPEPDTPVVLRPHLLWRLRRVADDVVLAATATS